MPPIATIGVFVIFLAFFNKSIEALYFVFFVNDKLKARGLEKSTKSVKIGLKNCNKLHKNYKIT